MPERTEAAKRWGFDIKEKEYIKATIHTTTQGAEALSAVLPALGIDGFCVEDPADFEFVVASKDRLAWDFADAELVAEAAGGEARVVFWLEKRAGADAGAMAPDAGAAADAGTVMADAGAVPSALIREVQGALLKLKGDEQCGLYGDGADFGRLWLDTQTVRDDWKDKYKESFHAFSPCEGIVVVPPWEAGGEASGTETGGAAACTETEGVVAAYTETEGVAEGIAGAGAETGGAAACTIGACTGIDAVADSRGGGIRLVIDPGMAFGTGLHETTAMCLARLKELLKPGDAVLDAGTGSGILAIAAALLGAGHVDAVEMDEDAAASAALNIAANGAGGVVSLITGDITVPGALPAGANYNLVTANLSCPLLEKLAPVFAGALADGGAMILSGLLDTQGDRALEALKNAGMEAREAIQDGEWLMIEARKREGCPCQPKQ